MFQTEGATGIKALRWKHSSMLQAHKPPEALEQSVNREKQPDPAL